MNLKLKIWRQSDKDAKGGMINYSIEDHFGCYKDIFNKIKDVTVTKQEIG